MSSTESIGTQQRGQVSMSFRATQSRLANLALGRSGLVSFLDRIGGILARRSEILVVPPELHAVTLARAAVPTSSAEWNEMIRLALVEHDHQQLLEITNAGLERQGFLAHELRGHISTAMLALQALEPRAGDAAVTAILGRSLRRLNELVDRSMAEVRLLSSTHHRERLGVATLVEELAAEGALDADHRGLKLKVEIDDESMFVDADRHLVATAISNLLRNAFRFTRPRGQVWFRARRNGERAELEVEDECGGLPGGADESVFLPYQQRGTNREGLGLGLAISRQAIELDGGTITFRDLPGRGCAFVIALPLAS